MTAIVDPLTPRARALLSLVMLPGLGSVRASRLLDAFGGSADRVLGASHAAWCAVPGIGRVTSEKARAGIPTVGDAVDAECERMARAGVRAVAIGDPGYPMLLADLPDAPRLLFIRGSFGGIEQEPSRDAYPVAIVGSRRCSQYGIEQAERFGGVLGRSGLTIVSGGARGIDTAAHRGCLRSGGRTVVVQGCGLGRVYPPENGALFDRIIAEDAGAIVSELPMLTEPRGEHFPARNRIISGLSLGVVVIEAGRKSGALITAAVAAEEHGREVMVVPGRVDSAASAGSLDLLKRGGGALVSEPGDVLAQLEAPARFAHDGLHAVRYADPGRTEDQASGAGGPESQNGVQRQAGKALFGEGGAPAENGDESEVMSALAACVGSAPGLSFDSLLGVVGCPAPRLRTALTMLELRGQIERCGSLFTMRGG